MSGCQRIWLAALAAGLVALSSAAWAYPPRYVMYGDRYAQKHKCLASVTVRLVAARVASGHVAVWSGVSSLDSENIWLQAGVEETSDPSQNVPQPFRYVEWSSPQATHLIRLGPGASLQVRLTRLGDRWHLVAGNRTWTVRIGPHTDCQIGAESWDNPGPNMVRGRVSYYGGRYEFHLPS